MTLLYSLLLIAAATPSDGAATLIVNDPDVFSCSPAIVGQKDRIVLKKRSAAYKELAVRRPDGTILFLVVGSPPPEMAPIMSPKKLASTGTLKLSVSTLTGLRWETDIRQELVFSKPGDYEFMLSTNLESDEGGYSCTVEFTGAK